MTSLPVHWVSTVLIQAAEAAGADPEAAAEAVEKTGDAAIQAESGMSTFQGFLAFLVVIAFLVVPFVLAWLVSKALKVPEWSGRFGVVFLTLSIASAPFLTQLAGGEPIGELFDLGIDLKSIIKIPIEIVEID